MARWRAASAISPRASASWASLLEPPPRGFADCPVRRACAAASAASSQRPRESSDWARFVQTHASESHRPHSCVSRRPSRRMRTASSERPTPSRAHGRFTWLRPTTEVRPRATTSPLTSYIWASPASMCPASTMRPPSVRRAFSSMSSAPTMRAYSTARSAADMASGPGSRSIDQLAAVASTSACTSEGGSPRTSSCAVSNSFQPSPRACAWTSRERWTQNQAARWGSPSSSSRCRARLVIFRARSRSPHSRPATAASAIRSR